MGYKIKVLSPVHIGCGEKYSGLNYILDKRVKPEKICILKEEDIFRYLNDRQTKLFLNYIEKEKFPRLFNFLRDKINDQNFKIQNTLQSKAIYSIQNLSGDYINKEVNTFIKQLNKVYIPGTEIKGAIRTAILYNLLIDNVNNIYDWLKTEIETFGNKYKEKIRGVADKSWVDKEIKKILVREAAKIEKDLQVKAFNVLNKKDAKYDFMKYLFVGDTELKKPEEVLCVTKIEPYNIISRSFTLFNESLKPDVEFKLTDFRIEDDFSKNIKIEKLQFSEVQKNIISSLAEILKCCYRFTNDLIDEEISFYKSKGKNDLKDYFNEIKKQNKQESPVIRIGKDQGYLSLTVGLAVNKKNPELYEKVLIHATKGKSYTGNNLLPKTRKIVKYQGRELTAGWAQLIKNK